MFDFLLNNSLLSSILAFIVVLIPAVIVHELGHFFAARATGVTVLEFGIGFPPRVMRLFMWGETEFTLNWIPLGGFVRPFGEDMIQDDVDRNSGEQTTYYSERQILAERGVLNPVSVYDAKPLARIFFFIAGAVANFILALVLFVVIGLMGIPEEVGSRLWISHLDEETVLYQEGLQKDDIITQINGQYFEDQAEFLSLLTQGDNPTLTVRRGLSQDSYQRGMDVEVVASDALIQEWVNNYLYIRVVGVLEDSPAEQAGILADDQILRVNDIDLNTVEMPTDALRDVTAKAEGQPITLSILREGEPIEISLIPRVNPSPNQGALGIQIRNEYMLGEQGAIVLQASQYVNQSQSLGQSFIYALENIGDVFKAIIELPRMIFSGNAQPEDTRLISIVGVSQLGGEILQASIVDDNLASLLRYVALISVALGITNLLPIPALDGGRILFAVIELVRGKPISPEREGFVHMFGLIFLLSLGILLIINDILNPVTDLMR
jgi:regulator of sigma E protease